MHDSKETDQAGGGGRHAGVLRPHDPRSGPVSYTHLPFLSGKSTDINKIPFDNFTPFPA